MPRVFARRFEVEDLARHYLANIEPRRSTLPEISGRVGAMGLAVPYLAELLRVARKIAWYDQPDQTLCARSNPDGQRFSRDSRHPARSRLDPCGGLIDKMRRRGPTNREFAQILAEKCRLNLCAEAGQWTAAPASRPILARKRPTPLRSGRRS